MQAMPQRTEYKVISGDSTSTFQVQLDSAVTDKWKPILLTSAASPTGMMIAAILERNHGK
jgi:hypothetical protein